MPWRPSAVSLHSSSGLERKTAGAMYGRDWLRNAFCRPSSDLSFFAFRFVRSSGLSKVRTAPLGRVLRHVCPLSTSEPGQLLISTRKTPFGEQMSKSISLIDPSLMTSKFAHAP
ncbi:unannotated protein [freshwater metagenome]|uniref:Unannotated protein n=1 Tax=freshwater metagenome TaxID=449393 RepID=A0A6J7FCK6_9ZZZZ